MTDLLRDNRAHMQEAEQAAMCGGPRAYTLADFPVALTGESLLTAWLKRDPERRSCDVKFTMDGRVDVTLWADTTRFNSSTQTTLDSAYRSVLMVAMRGGEQ